ncbi:hypothetical protein R1sor_003218 [Riccia sorocarpa]|uniref:F-box protein n=1 Tax=Riccia sorocarpa TaxID=122646 RepID=A0ABD3H543_9MARC
MDPKIWKHLTDHEDILRLIRVSWDTNLRLRSVSKGFYVTLSEPSLFTWSSVLSDTSFYTNHSNLEWSPEGQKECCCWRKGIPNDDLEANIYELDRFLFNPLTKGFSKLPVVPKVKGSSALAWNGLRSRMIMTVEKELVTVVAMEFSQYSEDAWWVPVLSRILVWHEGSEDWKPLETYDPRCTSITSVDSAVFVDGELFLHVVDDMDDNELPSRDRVFSCGSRATEPELIFICEKEFSDYPVLHLFQYKGALKRLELAVVTGGCCHIELFTSDRLSRCWQEEEIEMPMQVQKSLCHFVSRVGIQKNICGRVRGYLVHR